MTGVKINLDIRITNQVYISLEVINHCLCQRSIRLASELTVGTLSFPPQIAQFHQSKDTIPH